jgi:ABC-2 type transport system ATP-binding protein
MKAAAIELTQVRKQFGPKVVLDGVDMRVDEGTVFGFLGANGAGKTTTVRLLLGLLRADAGHVRVLGLDPAVDAKEVRRRVGVLLDHDGHYDRLTALQNLEFHAGIRRVDRDVSRRRTEVLLRAMGLWEKRAERVAVFSKGMRQKLAVARALLGEPKLLLLDEPFTGLDPAAAVDLRDRLRALASDAGVTILLTTHDLHHVEKICDAVTVLDGGRVAAAGALGDLLRADAQGDAEDVVVTGDQMGDAVLASLVDDGIASTYRRIEADRVVVRCTPAARKRLASELVKRGVEIREIARQTQTLEERFMKIVTPAGES